MRSIRSSACRAAVSVIGIMVSGMWAAPGRAQSTTAGVPTIEDLQGLTLDDLANVEVTSVSKHAETLATAPAAIFVITADDIRSSSATSLPEVLRMAPNLEVARINAYSWTVTARGFNSPETANKLLVLINGRSVYEPIGGGVLWQQVDVDLANVSRIEVISGPGGTMWGANAVNGVINVITKDQAETQGFYAEVSAGGFERNAAVRFGGMLSQHVGYKLIANAFDTDSTVPATAGDITNDAFHGAFMSATLNGEWDRDTWAVGLATHNNRIADGRGDLTGSLARLIWNRDLGGSAGLNVSAVISRDVREEPVLYESRDSVVLAASHNFPIGTRQNIVWGGEYRYWWENFDSFVDFRFADPKTNISLGSLFVQDEIALRRALKLTLGLKAEHNSYSGLEWLPNLRLAWELNDGSLVWAAASQAARTPNRIERELTHPAILMPSPDFGSETVTAYELGWRARPLDRVSMSLSAFYNVYDDLRTDTYPVAILPIVLKNGAEGETYGLEGWGKYAVTPTWRLSAGFNVLRKNFRLKPGFNDLTNLQVQGQDPDYQAQIRSQWAVTPTVDVNVTLRTVGKVDMAPVPAYTEADAHIAWQVTDKLEVSLDGLNLLHKGHIEVWDPSTAPVRYVPRSIFVTLRYGL